MRFGLAVVEGLSMIPTFTPGEKLLVSYGAKVKTGDIVILTVEKRMDIKRIVKIQENEIYVEGDNSQVSIDSRSYGPVNRDAIVAKFICRLPRWAYKK